LGDRKLKILAVTEAGFADALGLLTIHVNRSLHELRGKRLITLRGKLLPVEDREGSRV
jgi:hypothetical protein